MSKAARIRVQWSRAFSRLGLTREFYLIPLAAIVGVLAGLVATGFDWLVEASGGFFFGFLGKQRFPQSDLLMLIILPTVGGLAVGLITRFFSQARISHGIPDVIEALARRHGRMQGRQAGVKMATASLTIGSGGSAGVEGPIIMVGSILGSVVSRWLHVKREHVHVLIGCGAAGGMAAIFNAPIAGVLFVLEVILRDFSIKTFMPIVVASVFGTATSQTFLGENEAVFMVPEAMRQYTFVLSEVGPYAVLGVACGLLGVAFSRLLRESETVWEKIRLPFWCKPAIGGALLGVLGIVLVLAYGGKVVPGYEPPAFFGNGYPVIEAFLDPVSYTADAPQAVEAKAEEQATQVLTRVRQPVAAASFALLGALLLLKLIGTTFTLASGGSGGVFAPSLFMGAMLGGMVGIAVNATGLLAPINPATYALAGMAGAIAAVAHCPLTAFLLVFEMTRDYKVILPVMFVAIVATVVAQTFSRDSIYAAWLRQMGIRVGLTSDMTLLRRLEVADVPLTPPVAVNPQDPAQRLIELAEDYAATDFVVCDDASRYVGMVCGEDLRTTLVQREAIPLMIVEELMRTNLPTCEAGETLDVVLDKFSQHDVASLAVLDEEQRVRGVISRSRLMRQYHKLLDQ